MSILADQLEEKIGPDKIISFGQGVAQKLFEKFVLEMKNRNIKQFKVVVGENLPQAIHFYEKAGFKFYSPVSIHENKPSRIYIYDI